MIGLVIGTFVLFIGYSYISIYRNNKFKEIALKKRRSTRKTNNMFGELLYED